MKSTLSLLAVAAAMAASVVHAEIQTSEVTYHDGDTPLKGQFYWDNAIEGKRPGVLVVHEWWGLNDYIMDRARMLAELGYIAFAADMYGEGRVTEHPAEAGEWSKAVTADVEAWRRRAQLGLEQLKGHELTDPGRTAAIGYCFGGATVMQMAYAGADVAGVASFHGSLPLPGEAEGTSIAPAVFIAHGNADGFIPVERVQQIKDVLEKAGADWEMHVYGGARHAFTNPDAGRFGIDNLAYDPKADERSWRALQGFFADIFM